MSLEINPITHITLDTIPNSCGSESPRVLFELQDGQSITSSVPAAIKKGDRESPLTNTDLSSLSTVPEIQNLIQTLKEYKYENQMQLDTHLQGLIGSNIIGADVSLAFSLSFARTLASARRQTLVEYIASEGGFKPGMPHPMVNIFSGGIHGGEIPFQQIMIIPRFDSLQEDVGASTKIYDEIEHKMINQGNFVDYSASKGMVVRDLNYEQLFSEISEQLTRVHCGETIALGVDVAAEHLKQTNRTYKFAGKDVSGEELLHIYYDLAQMFNLLYIEDPFHPDDEILWKQLKLNLGDDRYIIGDDLFATNSEYINGELATGILLKMNQIGTLTGTIQAAQMARSKNLSLSVSHRSCETDDTAMCDLAVATGADLIKVGGPKEERLIKYRRLETLAHDM